MMLLESVRKYQMKHKSEWRTSVLILISVYMPPPSSGKNGIFEQFSPKNQSKGLETKLLGQDYSDHGGEDGGEDGGEVGGEDGGEDGCELSRALQGVLRTGRQKNSNTNTNRLWSTLSTYLVLSILYIGTSGQSREQLGSLLGGSKDKELVTSELHSWLSRIVCKDCLADKQAQLVLVNAVLVKVTRDKVKEEFLKEMTEAGKIGREESINSMYHVEFNDKEATERINSWTKNMTKGMIKDILKPDQVNGDTALVLINLLYFNGQWKTKFSPGATSKSIFHTPSGDQEVEMMYKKEEMEFGYDSANGYSWVELPYVGDKFAMVAYLPSQGEDLSSMDKLEAALANQTTCNKQQTTKTEVELFFPKFVLEYEEDLSAGLKDAGVKDLFNFKTNSFSNMIKSSKEEMAITSILQSTKIQVDEKGTKAAAATKVIVESNRMGGGGPLVMRFDRPFVFNIVSLPEKLPIFGGMVVNPGHADQNKTDVEEVKAAEQETGQDYSDDMTDPFTEPMGILDDENLQKKKHSNIIPLLDQFSWCDLQRPEMRKLIRLLDTCNKYNISAEKCQMLERECQDEQTTVKQRRHSSATCTSYYQLCQDLLQLKHHCRQVLEPLRSSHQKICEEIGTDVDEKVHAFWKEFSKQLDKALVKTLKFDLF